MTRSSNKGLVTPYEELERVIHSTGKLFKTTSLDYSSSPEFDLFSDLEDQFEQENIETMGEQTLEEYMTKTREDYGLGIARLKFDEKAKFELKGQFLKELRDNTFSGSDNEDANEHTERVLEIADLFTIPDATQDQLMLCLGTIQGTFGEMSSTLLDQYAGSDLVLQRIRCPTRQILDCKGVVPKMNAADAEKAIQDKANHSQKWHNETSTRCRSSDTSDGLSAIQAQLNNLGIEIKKVNKRVYAAQVGCESCNRPHYTIDFPLKEEGKTLEEAYYTQFGVPFP
ncbi:hypothetical protein Tco_0378632 [Tanacetum coccineum]